MCVLHIGMMCRPTAYMLCAVYGVVCAVYGVCMCGNVCGMCVVSVLYIYHVITR